MSVLAFDASGRVLRVVMLVGVLAAGVVGWLALGAGQSSPSLDRAGSSGPGSVGGVRPAGGVAARRDALAAYGRLPLRFEANRGQTDPRVDFLARGPGYSVFLTGPEAVLSIARHRPAVRGGQVTGAGPERGAGGAVIRMRLLGARANPALVVRRPLAGTSNYLVGKNKQNWRTGVPGYGTVRYRSVYPGTDVVYYGRQGRLEYDFVVAAGAKPGAIALGFDGARGVRLDRRGGLVLDTAAGRLRQPRPVVYQRFGDKRHAVSGRYVLRGKRAIGFRVGAYDHARPLIIDPVLVYSTYLGGSANSGQQGAGDIAVDSLGSAYISGYSGNTDYPTTSGAYDLVCGGCPANADAVVTKLNPAGQLVYSTFLGGAGYDSASDIAVNPTCASSCPAYVAGMAGGGFPIIGGRQTTLSGPSDAFLAKLSADGTRLLYSSYLGGSGGIDFPPSIAVDPSDAAYLSGSTNSTDFPLKNAYDSSCGCPAPFGTDVYVAKVDPSTTGDASLVYSTYLGGSGQESPGGIAVDATGNAYIAGATSSGDFPTVAPYQSYHPPGTDAFVAKLNPAGSALLFSTYLGGSAGEQASDIAIDGTGHAYVTGYTSSGDFPTTAGSFQTTKAESNTAYVAELNTAGGTGALVYGTYLGAENTATTASQTAGSGIAVDPSGSAYVTGNTTSRDFPAVGALQPVLQGGTDAFVTKINAAGSALDYSTYLGGSAGDDGKGIAVPASCTPPCRAFVAGNTGSDDFPTKDAVQATRPGGGSAFVTALDPMPSGAAPSVRGLSVHSGPVEGGTTVTITGTDLTSVTAVQFGDVPAASFTVVSSKTITAVTPAHSATIVSVTVTGPGGTSAPSQYSKFLFGLGRWNPTGSMGTPRSNHTATLLSDGRVLVVGGGLSSFTGYYGDPVKSAEVYDPKTGTWSSTGNMTVARAQHTATLLTGPACKLPSPPTYCGKVLMSGGASTRDPATGELSQLATAELYDPNATDSATGRKGSFTAVRGTMSTPRSQHTATLLPDGKVLLADGCHPGVTSDRSRSGVNCWANEAYALKASADIFDPATPDRMASGGRPAFGRVGHSATMLPNGKVLFVGGTQKSVYGSGSFGIIPTLAPNELFDPATKAWTTGGQENDPRANHSATLLPSGKVLIAAGSSGHTYPIFKKTSELYDPPTAAWSLTSFMKAAHSSVPAALLANGQVLVASGGEDGEPPYTSNLSELFDPSGSGGSGAWLAAMPTIFGREAGSNPNHTVTLLSSDPEHFAADRSVCGDNCGKVLVTGGESGYSSPGGQMVTDSSELYTPAPSISALSPASGPAAGGTTVTITGTGFTNNVTGVRFGDTPATSFTVDSYSQITAVSPASTDPTVPVVVVSDGGKSPATSAGTFTFDGATGGGGTGGTGGGTGTGTPPPGTSPTGTSPTSPTSSTSPTGTSGSGSGSGSAADTTRPVLSGLSALPAQFTIGSLLPRLAHVAQVGTTIRFSVSERSAVSLTFARRRSGRRVGTRCRPPSFVLRDKPRCTRYVTVTPSVRFANVRAGTNRVRFAGRLSATRTLRPGTYRLTVRATDAAGNRSRPQRTVLTAKRG